ncbi:MAG: PDDEXK nuclease domain-containing protein [Candidatus Gracilibacteria bacterium]|jgi:predicted nuclease of restriction endonuclease-like (RecB) superfamily
MNNFLNKNEYKSLLLNIGGILEDGRKQAYKTVNNVLIKTYWEIGKSIVEFEQKGKFKAEYGTELLDQLSCDLKFRYGKGFCRRNILDMRRFYIFYPIRQTLSAELSWSHYVQLISIKNDFSRNFYEKQCLREKWSVRELDRQKNSMLFERIALSKDKKEVIALSKKGQVIRNEKDIIKEPYILEFLGIPENYKHSEQELEQKIIDNLQMFLLELGKGFTFVKRQFRISFKNKHFYVDLVFYHRILKCFILIDLKVNEVEHTDIGQMNMYLNYFGKEENLSDDNPPIGIILGAYKDEIKIEYALGGISNKLFVSKYQLYLPKKDELEKQVLKLLN